MTLTPVAPVTVTLSPLAQELNASYEETVKHYIEAHPGWLEAVEQRILGQLREEAKTSHSYAGELDKIAWHAHQQVPLVWGHRSHVGKDIVRRMLRSLGQYGLTIEDDHPLSNRVLVRWDVRTLERAAEQRD